VTFFIQNLAVYSLQLAALTATAVLTTYLLRLRAPLMAWRFWQVVMLAALLLPIVQPRRAIDVPRIFTAASIGTSVPSADPTAALLGADWSTLVLAILCLGILTRLAWLAAGIVRVRAIVGAASFEPSLAPLLDDLNRSLGTHATLLISGELEGPATVGVRRPVVLLPRRVLDMPASVQRAIVCHELVHVTRRDWVQTIAEEIWCAVLWFHPAARLIASRLSLARETVVDQITIRLTRDRRAYAEALLAFSNPQPHIVGVTPFIGRRTLGHRIALIAQESPASHQRSLASLAIAVAASGSLTAAAVDRFPMSGVPQADVVYAPGPASGVTLPRVVKEVKPQYTARAMQKKIQGSVWLSCVVSPGGKIVEVKVTKSLDDEFGLDQEAIRAASQWEFEPGRKDGKPVAVRVTIELTFTLRK
jgi:TonB family protein